MSFYLDPEKWEYTGDLGLIACCSQNDVQCLKHTQAFPDVDLCTYSTYADADTHTIWISMCYQDIWPKKVTNHGLTRLFRQPWWMILPMRDSAGNRKSGLRDRERKEGGQSHPELRWSMPGLTLIKARYFHMKISIYLSHMTPNKMLTELLQHLKHCKNKSTSLDKKLNNKQSKGSLRVK